MPEFFKIIEIRRQVINNKFSEQEILELGKKIITDLEKMYYTDKSYHSELMGTRIKLFQAWRELEPLYFVSMATMIDNLEKIIDMINTITKKELEKNSF